MNIGGIELNVGDTISYDRYRYVSNKSKPQRFEGVIVDIQGTVIAVDLGKYRDSFTLQDLACGTVEIPGMAKIKLTTSEIPEETKPAVNMRLPNGQVNWTVVWPIVKAELDNGRDKYDIAAELGIGRNAMKNKVQKMTGHKSKEAKPVVSDLEKMQTIAELMAYKEHLTAERKLVDLVLRFVDIALREKEGVSESE